MTARNLVGAAEAEVGRYVYRRIEALMDAAPGTPEATELVYLSDIAEQIEEYGEEACGATALSEAFGRLSVARERQPVSVPSATTESAEPAAAESEPLPWNEIPPAQALGRWVLQDHPGLHERTAKLVRTFAFALANKLRTAERKYNYSDGWATGDWEAECQRQLLEHVRKGDPLDVAAYAAFCWFRKWPACAASESPSDIGWRSIDTAPRDGTPILVAHVGNGAIFDAYWDEGVARWVDGSTDNYDDLVTYSPSHWRPMPSPPLAAQDTTEPNGLAGDTQ